MKKKIILLVAALMIFATGVSASSLNGEYKGNPIVKLKSSGSLVDTGDVPAMIYDGKTMVPIAALRNLGANVSWNADTYSVDVSLPTTSSSVSDIRVLSNKMNAKIANMYKITETLSDDMKDYSDILSTYFSGHNYNYSSALSDVKLNASLQLLIDSYNVVSDRYNIIIREYPNIDFRDLYNLVQNNYKALDQYKAATTHITNWNYYKNIYDTSNSQSSFNSYLSIQNDAFNLAIQAKYSARTNYDKYMLLIINN